MTDKMTKEEALQKIEELQKYVADKDVEVKGYVIKNRFNDIVIYVSKCADLRDAFFEAVLYGANLRASDLHATDLREADLQNAMFYGKGGTSKLKKSQVTDFLAALGFQVDDQL